MAHPPPGLTRPKKTAAPTVHPRALALGWLDCPGPETTDDMLFVASLVVTEWVYEEECDAGLHDFDPKIRERRFASLTADQQAYAWALYGHHAAFASFEAMGGLMRDVLMSFSPFWRRCDWHHNDIRRRLESVVVIHPRRNSPRISRRSRARRRGAGRPRAQACRSSAKSGDSGDDGPGEPPPASLRESGVPS
jgi:hypothetical protein